MVLAVKELVIWGDRKKKTLAAFHKKCDLLVTYGVSETWLDFRVCLILITNIRTVVPLLQLSS